MTVRVRHLPKPAPTLGPAAHAQTHLWICTVSMPRARAMAQACCPPAPPKQASTWAEGSWPRAWAARRQSGAHPTLLGCPPLTPVGLPEAGAGLGGEGKS